MIGQTGLMTTTMNENTVVEIGYIFDNTYWHNGYATEPAESLIAYAFDNLDCRLFIVSIRPENNFIRVAKRLGMESCRQPYCRLPG